MHHVVTDPSHPYADFRNFLYVVWKYLNLPDPTPVQYDIAWNLQHGPTRFIVEAFRGVGKSFITAAFVCWLLWWSPNLKILVVSASKDRADAFSQFVLRLICDMPELKHLTPRSNQRRSLIAFDVNGATPDQSPSVKSVGITGQLTGSRADVIIGDDVETPKNSQTQMQREKLGELVKEFDAILKPLPGSRILYLGTPQCEDSLYNELVKRGYTAMIWPARMPADISKYVGKLATYIAELTIKPGTTTDPRRFTDVDLMNREASYGRTGFALQFMLDTSLSDALKFPLKCSDFIVADIDREVGPVKITYASGEDQLLELPCVGMKGDRWYGAMYVSRDHAPYQGAVMFVDPSGRGADRTAFAVVKMLNGTLYLRRCGSLAGGFDDSTMMTLANIAKNEKVTEVVVEENFGGGMFAALLKPHLQRIYPCNVSEVFQTKQKEARIIDTLEPVLNQHRLVIDKAIVAQDMTLEPEHQLIHQLTRLTREKNALSHDDLIDALAGAVAYWVERLDVDQSDSEEKHREELMDKEIARFMQNAMGGSWSASPDNWTTAV